MAATLTHRSGEMTGLSTAAQIEGLLSELDEPADQEHPDVAIADDTGLTLSAFTSGLVVMEDVESGAEPVYLRNVPRAEARHLFVLLARGERLALAARDWQPGYGA